MRPAKRSGDLEAVRVKACVVILTWIRMRSAKRRKRRGKEEALGTHVFVVA